MTRRPDDDGWVICSTDSCLWIKIDWAVSVETNDGYAFRIEEPFALTLPGGVEQTLTPEGDPALLGPVLAVARTTLTSASALDDGGLHLDFGSGATIKVGPGNDYEAWTANGPGEADQGLLVVSMPGGGLALWF
ncbi:hypothetical protein GCM10009633_19220 [Janibacter melonis]